MSKSSRIGQSPLLREESEPEMRAVEVVRAKEVLDPIISAIPDRDLRRQAERSLYDLLARCEEYEAIQYAAEFLPDGWEVVLHIEKHGGFVALIDPDGEEETMAQGEGVGLDIRCACDDAKERSSVPQ